MGSSTGIFAFLLLFIFAADVSAAKKTTPADSSSADQTAPAPAADQSDTLKQKAVPEPQPPKHEPKPHVQKKAQRTGSESATFEYKQ